MRNGFLCLAAAAAILMAAPSIADAAMFEPVAPTMNAAAPAAPVDVDASLIFVAGGCGRGFHRGPYGRCRRNWAPPRRPARHRYRCVRRWTPYGWRRFCRYY